VTELATSETSTAANGFNDAELAMLAQLGLSDVPRGDLLLFHHVCQTSGLDPFRREIYMVGRNTKVTRWEPNRDGAGQHRVERFETVYTIQTGIQGFRKRAREIADRKRERLGFDGPFWCGEDGQWKEVWPEGSIPVAAKYVVFRNGEPAPAVCHYAEYVQTVTIDGQGKPNTMWAKMPCNQLAKCAEAAALQRAFPDELSGLLLEDAARDYQVVNVPEPIIEQPRLGGRGVAALRARAQADTEYVQPPAIPEEPLTAAQNRKMHALFRDARITDRDDRLTITGRILGYTLDTSASLTKTEASKIIDTLEGWQQQNQLDQQITEILNAATIIEATEKGSQE